MKLKAIFLTVSVVVIFIISSVLSTDGNSIEKIMFLFVLYIYGYHLFFSLIFNEDMIVSAFDLPAEGSKPLRRLFGFGGFFLMIVIVAELALG